MQLLDLINPYPISEHLIQAPWENAEEIERRRRRLRTIHSPLELARIMAQSHGDNALPNALHDSLKNNESYKLAKRATPFLKDSPAISRYRNSSKKTHDPTAIIEEILNAGTFMPAGQVLFHGGPWPESGTLPLIDTAFFNHQPLSTSLCPQVAKLHSFYEPRGFLWYISLCNAIPCFVFNNKNRILGHEFEVLLPPIEIVCTTIETDGLTTPLLHVRAKYKAP